MEVNGKEFMRNVAIEQDKDRLIAEHNKLEQQKRESVMRQQSYSNDNQEGDSAYVDLSLNNTPPIEHAEENVIQDLMLDPEDPNKNKKRYIVLGFGLILLFIITLLVIRLISNNDTKEQMENLNPEAKALVTDKILDKIDTNEEYQKVIDRKIALDEASKMDQNKNTTINEINIPNETKVENTPIIIDTPKPKVEPKRDLFGLDKTQQQQAEVQSVVPAKAKPEVKVTPKVEPVKQVVKKQVEKPLSQPKKQIVIAPANQTNFTQKATDLSGYFIQIGAFTKEPSNTLLKSISQKGYNYKVHTMSIKGRLYNKVLIGPYPTRETSVNVIEKVRKDFKNPKTYILKF